MSKWPKYIHFPRDVLGMKGLQVTTSGLERSNLLQHDVVSVDQAVRHVGQ